MSDTVRDGARITRRFQGGLGDPLQAIWRIDE